MRVRPLQGPTVVHKPKFLKDLFWKSNFFIQSRLCFEIIIDFRRNYFQSCLNSQDRNPLIWRLRLPCDHIRIKIGDHIKISAIGNSLAMRKCCNLVELTVGSSEVGGLKGYLADRPISIW